MIRILSAALLLHTAHALAPPAQALRTLAKTSGDDDAEEKDGYGKGISRDKWCDPTVDLAGLGLQCFWTT